MYYNKIAFSQNAARNQENEAQSLFTSLNQMYSQTLLCTEMMTINHKGING